MSARETAENDAPPVCDCSARNPLKAHGGDPAYCPVHGDLTRVASPGDGYDMTAEMNQRVTTSPHDPRREPTRVIPPEVFPVVDDRDDAPTITWTVSPTPGGRGAAFSRCNDLHHTERPERPCPDCLAYYGVTP